MKFLVAFYAVIGAAVSLGAVAMLIESALLGMLVVVIALFAAIGVLAVGLIGTDTEDDDSHALPTG